MPLPAESAPQPSRLARDSAVVGAATIASRLLGFARDVLIARLLGTGPVADAFLAALRLPNLVRRVLGEGGLNAPFVPLYLAVKAEQGEEAARRFAGEAAGRLGLLLLILAGLGELFAPWVVLGLASGFSDEPGTLALASLYTRLMLPYLALTTLAAMLAALLNAEKRFALAALAPVAMNAVLVAFLLAAMLRDAAPALAAPWLAATVSLTGLAHLALILVGLRRLGPVRLRLSWSPAMSQLLRIGGATLLAASAGQLVLLVATQIASAEPGSVAALYYADRIFQLPLSFVGVAMGTVVLSEMAGAGRQDAAAHGRALVLGLALAVPAALALAVLARPIVSVLFEHGRFDAADSARTTATLAAFALGLPFAVAAKVFGQIYFVQRAPRWPLLAGLLAVLSAALIGLAVPGGDNPARLAALAASLAFVAQAGLLALAVIRDGAWRPHATNLKPLAAIAAASLAMLAVLRIVEPALSGTMAPDQPGLLRLGALALLCTAGLCGYAATAWLFGLFRRPS
jgi:putative peptidoglycan lipid II flippase